MSATNNTNSDTLNVSAIEQVDNPLIPELREQDQWVCWKYEERDGKKTKIPVNPHTGQYASSSDPDTWSDLDTALEYHESNTETDGIGVVFGSDDFVAGIDLDNVRHPETGELEYWAEEVIARADSYTEVSPSGTGIHILLYGMMPDGRTRANQNSTLDVFDTSEMEMYDSGRFFTVTFDHLDYSPTELKQRKNKLMDIHADYLARDDQQETVETTTEASESELDLSDQELIEKAKNAQNGREFARLWNGDTSAYDGDHSRADQALCNHLAFWTQNDPTRIAQLFEKSGLVRGKWLERKDYRQRTIRNAIKNTNETYQPPQKDSREGETFTTTIPESADTNLIEQAGAYFEPYQNDDGEVEYSQVTNFTLKAQAYVVDEHGDEHVDLQVRPFSDTEDSYDVVVPWTCFNEIRKFKDNVVTGRTTTFSGSPRHLNDLRLIVSHQGAPKLQKTTKLGLHNDEIVTVDGVLGTDDPHHRYVEKNIAMENKFKLNQVDDFDEKEVARILELLPQVRDKERFLPVLGWWYASLLTPYIREWEGEVPFLGVFGETGSGKTSSIQALSQMIGMDTAPASARSTKFSLQQHFAASTNIPLWIDEYKPSDLEKWRVDTLHDYIRTATRGGETNSGNADKSEDRYTYLSPVLVSGEQVIHGSAENRRMIPVKLRKASTKGETAEKWMELTGGTSDQNGEITHYDGYDLSEHAPAYWNYILNIDETEAKEVWRDAKEYAYKIAYEAGVEDLESLEVTSIAMVKFGLAIYRHFASTIGAEPPITEAEIEQALHYIAGNSGQENRQNHLDEFLSLITAAARADYAEAWTHYAVVNEGKPNEQLCIKLDQMHHCVRKYIREHDISTDVFNSHRDYRDRLNEAENDAESYVMNTSKVHADLNRCVAISMEQAEQEVDGFDHKAFDR
jgi:primase-polymerase (primpol)-like protein